MLKSVVEFRVAFTVAVYLLLLLFSQVSLAEAESPEALIAKMLDRQLPLNYSGIHIVSIKGKGGVDYKFRKWMANDGRFRVEFLEPEDLAGLIAVRGEPKGSILVSREVNEKGELVALQEAYSKSFIRNFQLLQQNYQFTQGKPEVMSGVKVLPINVHAKGRRQRPEMKLWVHERSCVPVRVERWDMKGKVQSVSYYEKLELHRSLSEGLFRLPESVKAHRLKRLKKERSIEVGEAQTMTEFRAYRPQHVPRGFELVRASLFRRTEVTWLHLAFTDGLATFSIFETEASKKDIDEAEKLRKDSNSKGNVVKRLTTAKAFSVFQTVNGKTKFVVMGEVTDREMVKLLTDPRLLPASKAAPDENS